MVWADAQGKVHAGPIGGPYRKVGNKYLTPEKKESRDTDPVPVISASGKWVGFRTAEDEAQIVEVETERVVHTVRHPGISGIAFGTQDTAFVSALDGTVAMIRSRGSDTLYAPEGGALFSIAAVRDATLIVGGMDQGPLYLWSALDGQLRATLRAIAGGGIAVAPDGTTEVFGKIESALDCRVGPFVFGLELCRERLVNKGALASAIAGRRIEP
jgi:hypothetical protein